MNSNEAQRVLDTADLVCPEAVVSEAVRRLAREISAVLADRFPVVLCVMRGAVVFAGQVLPLLKFPLEVDYLHPTRYRNTTRGGEIEWKVAPPAAIAGRTVLVLDDILDEGNTLAAIRSGLMAAGAGQVYCAVFAEKEIGRPKPAAADFIGVRLPDRYLFGFGMDVRGAWRNLPEIYALKETP